MVVELFRGGLLSLYLVLVYGVVIGGLCLAVMVLGCGGRV
jgi:hypothetical protein